MKQEDYLLREFERMMRAISEILSRFKSKKEIEYLEIYTEVKKEFSKMLGLDLDRLILKKNDKSFIEHLEQDFDFQTKEFESLADILFQLSQKAPNSNELLKKSLFLYKHILQNGTIFNLFWETRISTINEMILNESTLHYF